ncbi:hypothetical protein [Archangium sp.]|uniref:SitA5 family polymorphic toxin n=1 Tax=Archangium sp. TaxID=1872627 RepID=UPI002D53B5FB|nr:hypothetical protein [Archangium sp.]HYO54338.1 hypothetical protein [Archangium sp.]
MSTRLYRTYSAGARLRAWLGGWALLVLFLFSACATGRPPGDRMFAGELRNPSLTPPPAPKEAVTLAPEAGLAGAVVYEVEVLEPGRVATRPVSVSRAEFQRTFQRLAREVQLKGKTPQQAARELLEGQVEQESEWMHLSGTWEAEVSRGRVLTLVPVDENSPLTPEADEALRGKYAGWCASRGGGDCLRLFDDGPYLRADDRRTLALALSFGSVLDETREALGRELDPQALVAMCLWTVSVYLALWLVPEPITKALAASLTVILVAWLGMDTVWGLMDGWARMATRAHQATTFAELREAGEDFARVLGTDAARAMILAVGALTGRTLGEVVGRVKSLPGYGLAGAQWEAQAGAATLGRLEVAVAQEGALARAVAAVETVAASPQGPLVVVMLKKGQGGGGSPRGGSSVTVAVRHRGGNQQVVLGNGQRWHLPRGKSLQDIPAEDEVGDQLQEAVTRAAKEWGPDKLSDNELRAIDKALKRGKYWLARLLEREARGRFVQDQVSRRFKHLYDFSLNKGVDVVDPRTGRRYEILSGTESNLARHGRRMAGEFFRMLTF